MRILSAIVLLLWAACYARCFAQQCGALSDAGPPPCESLCCHEEEEQNEAPAPEPAPPCGVCEYIQNGGPLPETGSKLPAPFLSLAVLPEIADFSQRLTSGELKNPGVRVLNTGPPFRVIRLAEWRAGRALPVRGPDILG